MGVLVDLTGHQFGWLTVKAHAGYTERRQSKWQCRCRCGSEITVLGYSLTTGAKRSCGECTYEGLNYASEIVHVER